MSNAFQFKQFTVVQNHSGFKVGTDGCLLGAWADVSKAKHILDIGTGSGVIALMLAQRNSEARITAIEINEESAAQACENFANSPFSSRLTVENKSLQLFIKQCDTRFDHIVCNPPFFSKSTLNQNQSQSLARHDVALNMSDLFKITEALLSENGAFSIVVPTERKEEIIAIAKTNDLFLTHLVSISPLPKREPNRFLMNFETTNQTAKLEHWNLYSETNVYSHQAADLLAPFYLKL